MYREIKAAGNVQKLIDLAMMQSEERAAKGGRFEDVGTRSDPRASSPPGMSVFRAQRSAIAKTWRFEPPTNATRKDTSIPTPAEGISIVAKRRDRCRRRAWRRRGGTSSRRRGRRGTRSGRRRRRGTRLDDLRLRRPRLKPRKSSRWNARSRRSTRKRTNRLKTRTDAGMADGGNTNRRWEGTRAEDGGDGNVETEAFSDGDVETECCGYDWRFARYVSLITRARSLHRLAHRTFRLGSWHAYTQLPAATYATRPSSFHVADRTAAGVAIVPLRNSAPVGPSVGSLTNPDTTSDGISIHSAPSSPPTRTTSPPRSPAATATHAGAETSARSTTRKTRDASASRTPPLSRGGSPRVITHARSRRGPRDDGGFRTCDVRVSNLRHGGERLGVGRVRRRLGGD